MTLDDVEYREGETVAITNVGSLCWVIPIEPGKMIDVGPDERLFICWECKIGRKTMRRATGVGCPTCGKPMSR